MNNIDKQKTGFRFGKHKLEVVALIGGIAHNGRTYKIVDVKTADGLPYRAIRLYNGQGKFIKQFLMEPEIAHEIGKYL